MTDRKLADDCFAHDRERLSHADTLTLLRERLHPIADKETVPLGVALGRILAHDCHAARPIPAHDNAAVDGYAVRHVDLVTDGSTRLPVAGRVAASVQDSMPFHAPDTATRIFTGAVMPEGADSIAMQEDCHVETDKDGGRAYVTIPAGLKCGANRRRAGEDVTGGDLLLGNGARVRPQDLARLASAGFAEVELYRPLKMGIFSTGDELRVPGSGDLAAGAVYDANQPMLEGLAKGLPVEAYALGILPDRAAAVQGALAAAAERFDVVVTSGGASVGEEDHLRTALQTLGACHLWQLAIKPGRPMMMGQIGATPVLGLPGNPVAVFVCWMLYVYPSLLRLSGASWYEPTAIMLPAGFSVPRKKEGRREFFRAWVEIEGDRSVLRKFERDGSGLITGLQSASGLAVIPEDATSVTEGDMLAYLPFSQYGICG